MSALGLIVKESEAIARERTPKTCPDGLILGERI